MPAKHTRFNAADFPPNLALENRNTTKDRVLDPFAAIPSALSFDTPDQRLFFNPTTDTSYGMSSPATNRRKKKEEKRERKKKRERGPAIKGKKTRGTNKALRDDIQP